MNSKLVVLIVLDGWGIAVPGPENPISQANTPTINSLWASYPHTTLQASGEAVGLPRGEAGNTETGHLNLGAGRIVYQDLPRINMAIENQTFFENPAFLQAVEHARKNNSNLHLMGLLGAGAVHSNKEHLFNLLKLCKMQNFDRVFLHIFTDGRDSPSTASVSYITELEKFLQDQQIGKIASLMGRYWAMDRDFRWERTAKAYFALTQGLCKQTKNALEAAIASHETGITDEFIEPCLITDNQGAPLAKISDGDSVIFYNFRIDRPRQLVAAFVYEDFENQTFADWGFDPYAVKYRGKHEATPPKTKPFKRGKKIQNLFFVTMTEYGKAFRDKTAIAFPPSQVELPIGAVLANKNIRQLRIAESEKERFVTFYFNGQNEARFPGEDWLIVESPNVPTYDLKPEMAAADITDAFLQSFTDTQISYGFVLINFANADMLGHTGNLEAVKKGCETIDNQIKRIISRVDTLGGITIVTADHGNAEEEKTEHTTNPVPFIVVAKEFLGRARTLPSGILADAAPTILSLMGIQVPGSMTGRILLQG